MGKSKLLRMLALCLAAVCLFGTVAALSYDLNGDGKSNVWDLQVAVNENKTDAEKGAALNEVLGGADELHPNAEGVYEIHSALGLYNMAANADKGYQFKLMDHIDLQGMDWTPVDTFKGTFDGNGKTISNFTVTKLSGNNLGFFGTVDHNGKDAEGNNLQSVVKNLNLRDVTITVPANATDFVYAGLVAGSNRGKIENCTTLGTIIDSRTKLEKDCRYGTIVGRNNDSKPAGTLTAGNTMDALEYYDFAPQSGTSTTTQYKEPAKVSSMMAMHFAALEEGSKSRIIGIAGYSVDSGMIDSATGKTAAQLKEDFPLVWQDITNSSYFDSQVLQDRRTAVAAAMYKMSTVEWTPHADLNYYENFVKAGYSRVGGKVYRGIPYNHGSSSIYRFMNYMELNADGRYQTTTEVPTEGYRFTDATVIAEINAALQAGQTVTASGKAIPADLAYEVKSSHHTGFPKYIGADCSSQALWAWRVVNATSGTGKVTSTHTNSMYICENYIKSYGIQPVNGFVLELPGDLNGDGENNGHADKSIYVNQYTRANKDFYMQTLGCVTKGDLLMDYTDEGGHTLVAMSDAVVIRDRKGVMDLDKSYIITAEQGGGGGTRTGKTADGKTWTSTCCVDEVNSFNTLFDVKTTTNYTKTFFPITCTALHVEDTPAAKVTISMTSGVVKSNFQIVASAINDGDMVYTQIAQYDHRKALNSLTVAEVHPAVTTGDTVKVLLADGNIYEFTY